MQVRDCGQWALHNMCMCTLCNCAHCTCHKSSCTLYESEVLVRGVWGSIVFLWWTAECLAPGLLSGGRVTQYVHHHLGIHHHYHHPVSSSSFVRFNLEEVLARPAHIPAYSPIFHISPSSFILIITQVIIIIVIFQSSSLLSYSTYSTSKLKPPSCLEMFCI